MFEVVEYKDASKGDVGHIYGGVRIVIASEFTTLAAAQQHIANMDPAGRRTLAIEEKGQR